MNIHNRLKQRLSDLSGSTFYFWPGYTNSPCGPVCVTRPISTALSTGESKKMFASKMQITTFAMILISIFNFFRKTKYRKSIGQFFISSCRHARKISHDDTGSRTDQYICKKMKRSKSLCIIHGSGACNDPNKNSNPISTISKHSEPKDPN